MGVNKPDHTADPLHRSLGLVRAISLDPAGRARLEYLARADMCHSGGVVQGGFVTGWIDNAMAHAALAREGARVTPITLEIKISFFAPARPGPVFAEAWVERSGRKTAFYEGRLTDADGNVLAKGTSTIMLADRTRVREAAKAATEEAQ